MKPVEPIEEMSPVHELLYERLKDGRYHSAESLKLIIKPDGTCQRSNFCSQLSRLRTKLREIGKDIIVIEADKRTFYQLTIRTEWPELFPIANTDSSDVDIPDDK